MRSNENQSNWDRNLRVLNNIAAFKEKKKILERIKNAAPSFQNISRNIFD